jgi:hypothetical protein
LKNSQSSYWIFAGTGMASGSVDGKEGGNGKQPYSPSSAADDDAADDDTTMEWSSNLDGVSQLFDTTNRDKGEGSKEAKGQTPPASTISSASSGSSAAAKDDINSTRSSCVIT